MCAHNMVPPPNIGSKYVSLDVASGVSMRSVNIVAISPYKSMSTG